MMGQQPGWRVGMRASLPMFMPTLAIGVTFGLLAQPVLGGAAAVVMSMLVWSGTAQFAALSVFGGGPLLASVAGLLANGRYVAMGFAIAPSLHAPAWRRAVNGVLLADASFAIAHRPGEGFDTDALEGAAPLQYLGWVTGTALGVAGASLLADPGRLGVEVLFPVFYLAILLPELRRSRAPVVVAFFSSVITVVMIPLAPNGLPVLAGAGAALLGLRDA